MMFEELENINLKPEPFQFYTAEELWTDEFLSQKMLEFHLDEKVDVASRNKKFIDSSVKWIISHFNVNDKTSICDFGCGPGLYTTPLAQKSAFVTGIDFSKRSIEYAKNTALKMNLDINYECQNYLEYNTDNKFDLILMLMCDYCALSPLQRENLLRIFSRLLKPEGSILLDVYSMAAYEKMFEQAGYENNLLNGFWSQQKYYGFLNTFKYEKEKLTLDKYTIIEEKMIRVFYNWYQHFSPNSIRSEFEKSNFKITSIYSDAAGTKYTALSTEFAIVAKLK